MTVSRNLRGRTKGLLAVGLAAVAMAAAVAPAAAQDPVSGGTLTMARTADIFTFDPYATQDDYSIFTELQVYDRLVKLAADGKSVEPELAESWEIAPDGLSATFKLRQGVKFSDGTPLTVDDVVFSLTRAIDQTGSWGFLFSPVTKVEAVDDSTVKLTLSEPFAPLELALSTFAASIYSKANFEQYGDTAGEHPLGTGAFMLDHWDKGSQVVLKKNPNYWQAGKPYLDGVTFTIVGDDNARVLQLQGSQVDAIDFVPPNQIDPLVASGAQLQKVDGTAVGWLTLNEAIKPLDEANVRCALAWAVDRDAIAKNVYFGNAAAAKSIIPSSTAYYD
ncbi:MAG: ABC transporter substrate-binding protein, partial [Chloroflexota bacterium]